MSKAPGIGVILRHLPAWRESGVEHRLKLLGCLDTPLAPASHKIESQVPVGFIYASNYLRG